jgi:hypothetical protein
MTKEEVIAKIKKKELFDGLSDIRVIDVQGAPLVSSLYPTILPDLVILLGYGEKNIKIYGEIKTQITPKTLNEIGKWLSRAKGLNPAELEIYALVCPYLSPQNQQYCQKNNIDFIDLSGNMLLRVPGTLLIERLDRTNLYKESKRRDPFRGASSRVLRVLLNKPNNDWTITGIEDELENESIRQNKKGLFSISVSSISKTVQSLEEEVLIRRDGLKIRVPDPKQLLFRWAEKYKERYKWLSRTSFKTNNPFGFDIELSIKGLINRFDNLDFTVTSSAASNFIAPFVNVDRIDVFLLDETKSDSLRNLINDRSVGPDFLFFYSYDAGVAMYSRMLKNIKFVSEIQVYLDCYARGGRDAKQAEYILSDVIEKQWRRND